MSVSPESKPKRSLFRRRPKTPGQPGRVAQIRQFYTETSKVDRTIPAWTWGTFIGVLAVCMLIGFLIHQPIPAAIIGIPLALLAALSVMMRRGEKAAFSQLKGQAGAAGVSLQSLRGGWSFEEQPVAIDPRTKDLVFRVIGPGGIVLVSEGPAHRVGKLLAAEERKVKRVASGAPITLLMAGEGEGQVEVEKLARTIMRLKGKLNKSEISEIQRRLRALGGMNTGIPKGVDPGKARVDRRAMRGR